jgi:hypothetical protein
MSYIPAAPERAENTGNYDPSATIQIKGIAVSCNVTQ